MPYNVSMLLLQVILAVMLLPVLQVRGIFLQGARHYDMGNYPHKPVYKRSVHFMFQSIFYSAANA